jgi:anti-anti-sigma regulatory factor/HAMP domain-containing protein
LEGFDPSKNFVLAVVGHKTGCAKGAPMEACSMSKSASPQGTDRSRRTLGQVFGDLPITIKLVLCFLALIGLAVGALAFFSDRITRPQLTEDISATLKSEARSQALIVGDVLANRIETLRAFSDGMGEDIESINRAYPSDPSVIQSQLRAADQQWRTLADTDPQVQSRLTNATATKLRAFGQSFPDYDELIITDRFGALVGAVERPAQYAFASETWWQAAWSNGQGDVTISQPALHSDRQVYGVRIAVPIYDPDSHETIGILYTGYHLNSIANLLAAVKVGQTGHARLFLPGDAFLAVEADKLLPADPTMLRQLQALPANAVELDDAGTSVLASWAPIATFKGESSVANLGWVLVITQDRTEALLPVTTTTLGIMVIGLITLVLTGLLAFGFARLISRPILRLTNGAEQIAGGDLSARVALSQNDELGVLAGSFNRMVATIQQRTNDLEAQYAAANAARAEAEAARAEIASQLATIDEQRTAIREMSVPILPLTDTTMVMPLIGALDSARLLLVQEQALHTIEQMRTHYLILDITGVPVIDTQVAQGVIKVIQAAQLLGTEVVLVGIRPEVAQAIVGLGIDLGRVITHSSLQSGLAHTSQEGSIRMRLR